MTPNNIIIEMCAINKLKDAVLRSKQVEPDIRDNDKTPSWDGEFRVYNGQEFSKTQLYGKIPVQVKGKWVPQFQRSSIKFDVEVGDLQNYQKDGGTIYFVVHIKDFDSYRIYYRVLLPFDLRQILSETKSQKTKRIKMDLFPYRHIDGIIRILMGFIQDKQKQGMLLPNVSSIADLRISGIEVENFELSMPYIGIKSPEDVFSHVLTESHYVYAKPKGMDVKFVVDKVNPTLISEERNEPVIANGETLYNSISIIRKANTEPQIHIGNCLTLIFEKDRAVINYTIPDTVREQIALMKLLCALLQKQDVRIGTITMSEGKMNLEGRSADELADQLAWLLQVDQTLRVLHVKKDLDLKGLPHTDFGKLCSFVKGISEGVPVPLGINGKSGIGTLNIGNITVALISKDSDSDNLFYISNLYDSRDLAYSLTDDPTSEKVPISPYTKLTKEEISTIDNIDFEHIAESVRSFPYSEIYGDLITLFILELLKFYDSKETSEDLILNIAEELVEFLFQNNSNEDLNKINLLQIYKRRRELSQEEKKYLVTLKQPGIPLQFQLAASILLGSFQEAEILFEQLGEEVKKEFENYPIYNLWKPNSISS